MNSKRNNTKETAKNNKYLIFIIAYIIPVKLKIKKQNTIIIIDFKLSIFIPLFFILLLKKSAKDVTNKINKNNKLFLIIFLSMSLPY